MLKIVVVMLRIWGSLTRIKGDVEVPGDGVQMNIWITVGLNLVRCMDEGFDLIIVMMGSTILYPMQVIMEII